MGLRALHVCLDTRDLGLQPLYPLLQLLDRHGVKVLLGELDERVAGLAREEIFEVHGPESLTLCPAKSIRTAP
jgi:hypothetical protein